MKDEAKYTLENIFLVYAICHESIIYAKENSF